MPGVSDVSGECTPSDVDVGRFFARLIGTDITICLGNRRSRLAGSHDTRLVEEVP